MTTITDQSPVQYDAELTASTDIVNIGVGIIGIATAWFVSLSGQKPCGGNSQEKFYTKRSSGASDSSPFEQNRLLNPLPTKSALDRLRSVLDSRLPILKDVAITQSWSRMIDATPDAIPVMDAAPDLNGLFIASGFSDHGFGPGLATGKIMALVQSNNVEYDLSRFRFSRFNDASALKLGPSI